MNPTTLGSWCAVPVGVASAARSSRRAPVPVPPDEIRSTSGSVRGTAARGLRKEILICFSVLGVLCIGTVILGVTRWQARKKVLIELERQQQIYENNLKRGFDAYQRAEAAGLLFVIKGEATSDSALFDALKRDELIYNVVYDRNYKDRHNAVRSEQKAMAPDRHKVETIEKWSKDDLEVHCSYGFAEDRTMPVVIASKNIKSLNGDTANLGGKITVVVKAENDLKFENAKKPKAAPQ
jgi:hypothetical protein